MLAGCAYFSWDKSRSHRSKFQLSRSWWHWILTTLATTTPLSQHITVFLTKGSIRLLFNKADTAFRLYTAVDLYVYILIYTFQTVCICGYDIHVCIAFLLSEGRRIYYLATVLSQQSVSQFPRQYHAPDACCCNDGHWTVNPCTAGAAYIRFRVSFRGNTVTLKSIKYFVIDAQLIKMLIFTHVYFS